MNRRSAMNRAPNDMLQLISKCVPQDRFDDDEPITVVEVPEDCKSQTTGDYQVTVDAKFGFNYLQLSSRESQDIPSSLRMEVIGSGSSGPRPGVDVVCAIDVSGSMRGEKIQLVQKTLMFMLEQLTENDRVCLIVFNNNVNRLTPLVALNQEGKRRLQDTISHMNAGGGTNIIDGLHTALRVLAGRRILNSVSSIILLSDGNDNNSHTALPRAKAALIETDVPRGFSIHTFGYGGDHDATLLNAISEEKNGAFYFVQNDESIADAFSNCLGELISVIADKVEVRLGTMATDVPFNLTKIYSESGDRTFRMPPLLQGDKKEAIFILNFPPHSERVPEGHVIEPVKGIVRYQFVGSGRIVEEEFTLRIPVYNEGFEGELEVDEDVMVNFYRVKAADILKEAGELGDRGMYAEARNIVIAGSEELRQCIVAGNPLIQVLISDLASAVDRFRDHQSWNVGGGQAAIKSKARNHWAKRGGGGAESMMYQNKMQANLNIQARSKITKF